MIVTFDLCHLSLTQNKPAGYDINLFKITITILLDPLMSVTEKETVKVGTTIESELYKKSGNYLTNI